tara:strand:- start:894 stop:1073 length:180 start_codon:yes stop_codon:yes gene_type:complete
VGCCGQQAYRNLGSAHCTDLAFGTGLHICRQLHLATSPQRFVQLINTDRAATIRVESVE